MKQLNLIRKLFAYTTCADHKQSFLFALPENDFQTVKHKTLAARNMDNALDGGKQHMEQSFCLA